MTVLRTYHDGSAFKSNSLLNSEKKTLEIVLYHHEFGIVNPLGSKTVKYKTSGFYFVLGDLPPQYRSRQKDIHLAIMCSSKLISKYGYQGGVVVITAAQLHLTKPELRFCAGSNPARGVSEIRDGEDLWQWSRWK